MDLLPLLIALGLLIALLFAILKIVELRKPPADAAPVESADAGPPPYEPRRALLSDAELRFLPALEQAIAQLWSGSARIYVQVPMSTVLQVTRGLDNSARQRWHNQIDRKTFDFVITDAHTRPLACIELDDSSHDRPKRRDRDDFVNRACAAASVNLIRIPGSARYDPATIAQALAPARLQAPRAPARSHPTPTA